MSSSTSVTPATYSIGGLKTQVRIYPNDSPDKAAKKAHKDSGTKERKDEKPTSVYPTYKYSRPFLYEAAIVDGIPYFISYGSTFDKILQFEDIKEPPSRTLRPPNRDEYPYRPYEFVNSDDLQRYLKLAEAESIDSLFQKAISIVKKYNDQDEYKLKLLAIDIIWSYFQDKSPTTHYVGIVGDNDSGKSSIGNTFEAVGYRAVNMTSPTAPNVFRTLGNIEPGQCTLILDEADRIDESTDMINILKSGNDYTKKVPKTNTNSWKVEWFFAYCLKIIIAEKSLSHFKAKGLLDRILPVNTAPGKAQLDIKEVTNPRGDLELEQALNELLDFRKLMLIYRLRHYEDPVLDLDIGIERRNRELCKPYIRLFHGSKAQKEAEETFQTLLDIKNRRKAGSIEAILIPVIMDLVGKKDTEISSREVWSFIKENLEGETNQNNPDEYRTSEYTLYRNTITKLLVDKFGAESKHTSKGNKIVFNREKLQRIQKAYDIDIKIKTKLKGEGCEGSEGSREDVTSSDEHKTVEDLRNGNGKDEDISKELRSKMYPIVLASPQEPSQPSQPSPKTAVTESLSMAEVVLREITFTDRVERFFYNDPDTPWMPLPDHDLEDSPCYPIIEQDKIKTSGQTYFKCKLHPNVWNIDIQGIEHHCKYKEPQNHRTEILRRCMELHGQTNHSSITYIP
jgi:hypothetical protein